MDGASAEHREKPFMMQGDFFKHWERFPAGTFDLILTDPPYGLFGQEIEDLAWDTTIDLSQLEETFTILLKPTGLVLLSCDLHFLTQLLTEFTTHFEYHHHYIWRKPGGMPVNKTHPITNHEFVVVFRRQGVKVQDLTWHPRETGIIGKPYKKTNSTTHVPTRRMKKSATNANTTGSRYMKTVLDAPSKPNMPKAERTSHPMQKPLALLRPLIRTYSNPGDLILDPFAGSGSTLVAASLEQRRAIGCEINSGYYEETQHRLSKIAEQEELFPPIDTHTKQEHT